MSTIAPRYHGPSALGDDARRFWNLTITLAFTDFKMRYFGSALGYFWSLMRPLLLFGVLYVVFTHVVKFGAGVKDYPVYLLTSIVLWTYFTEATGAAVTCLITREGLIRKIRFPRMVIPLSVSLTALFNLAVNLLAVAVFIALSGVHPRLGWLEMPLLVALLAVLATGVAMLLSALFVRHRDIAPIWEVLLQVIFYGSPVIYVVTAVPDSIERWMMVNPLAAILTEMRHTLIDVNAPTASEVAGGSAFLLIPLGIILALFALGLWVFNRETPRIAENL